LDPVSVYIKLSPNPDWMNKAKKVMIQKIKLCICVHHLVSYGKYIECIIKRMV